MDENSEKGESKNLLDYHDLASLKARNWTARLVKQFLGEPDDSKRTTSAHTGRPKNLYCAKRVAFIEMHDSQFKAEKEKAALYSGRLKQTQHSIKKEPRWYR